MGIVLIQTMEFLSIALDMVTPVVTALEVGVPLQPLPGHPPPHTGIPSLTAPSSTVWCQKRKVARPTDLTTHHTRGLSCPQQMPREKSLKLTKLRS